MRNASAVLPKRLGSAAALTLAGILLLPSLAGAQQRGTISGSVTDGNNKPLPGVSITLTSREDESLRRSTVTDAKGRYEVGELPAGTMIITADLPGFGAGVKTQRLTSGRREVWLVLEPGPLEETETIPGPNPRVWILPLRQDQ